MALTHSTDLREVPVDWRALENAVENNASDVNSYLHLVSGAVLRLVDRIADPDVQARVAGSKDYLRVDPVRSHEQYRWMEQFIATVGDDGLRRSLLDAIEGTGAFRRFKSALASSAEERERWYSFRGERLRAFMEAWLTARGIAPVEELAPQSEVRELRPRIEEAPRRPPVLRKPAGRPSREVASPVAEHREPIAMSEEDELVMERLVATVHAKHGASAEQLAHLLRLGDDDAFDHLSELVISSRLGMVDGRYYPVDATPSGNLRGARR
jgi:hypothetical protein